MLAGALGAGQTGRAGPHSAAAAAAEASAAAAAEGDVWAGWAAAHEQLLQSVLAEPQQLPQAAAAAQVVSLLLGGEGGAGDATTAAAAAAAAPAVSSSHAASVDPEHLLAGYLQSSDGGRASDPRLTFLSGAVSQLEGPAAVGASFPALLGPLLQLGLLSSRQVHHTTLAVEAARWGGRVPLLGPSTTAAKAALSAVELTDFHRCVRGGLCLMVTAGCQHLAVCLCGVVMERAYATGVAANVLGKRAGAGLWAASAVAAGMMAG